MPLAQGHFLLTRTGCRSSAVSERYRFVRKNLHQAQSTLAPVHVEYVQLRFGKERTAERVVLKHDEELWQMGLVCSLETNSYRL